MINAFMGNYIASEALTDSLGKHIGDMPSSIDGSRVKTQMLIERSRIRNIIRGQINRVILNQVKGI